MVHGQSRGVADDTAMIHALFRPRRGFAPVALALALSVPLGVGWAQAGPVPVAAQTEDDAYTRYELLAPGSGRFRIVYDVSATTPGATVYFNPIRKGSVASDERVTDRRTGRALKFDVVGTDVARAGGVADAEPDGRYIRVTLARPVPDGGEGRIRIEKTYADAKSYFEAGDRIVFDRSLGIKRNTVVMPPDYAPVSCNYPSQVLRAEDGRIVLSFWNDGPTPVPLRIEALRAGAFGAVPATLVTRLDERAAQTREIVYYLDDPDTHRFALTHDYTEARPGVGVYTNVVRAGSTVSNPSARDLDTGEMLPQQVRKGAGIGAAGGEMEGVTPETEAVLFRFDPPRAGESRRIRISETYTDGVRYRREGDALIWDRSFGRPSNAVVLPPGWALTSSAIPATISLTADRRVRLDFVNARPDEIGVLIVAHRVAATGDPR